MIFQRGLFVENIICIFFLGPTGSQLGGYYWTSGSDEFHEGIFSWCGTSKAVNVSSDFKFAVGEPNNYRGEENCIQALVGPSAFLYNDNGCPKPYKYICEVSF
jgi:hypothetical protein